MPDKGFKTCYDCKKTLPACRFYNGSTSPQGNRVYCDACTAIRKQKQVIAARKKYRRRKKRIQKQVRQNKRRQAPCGDFFDKEHQEKQVYNFCVRFNCRLCKTLKRIGTSKEGILPGEVLGISPEVAWEYLVKTYETNYGEKWRGQPYEIDHIVPICTAKTKEELLKLFHYTNLQMLTAKDNSEKGNSLEWKSPRQRSAMWYNSINN